MKLSHLRDVVVVAKSGSLRAASRQLQVAQPAITRSIREIEHELGATLFERHARGVKLTSLGAAFVRRAESVQEELRRAAEEIAQLKGGGKGEVTIAVSTASCMSLMPAATQLFYHRYPQAVLKISESLFQPIETDVLNGRFDFYVGPLDDSGSYPQFNVERLFEIRRMVVARKGHALAAARSLKELDGARWIRPTMSNRMTEGDFDGLFARLGLPPPDIVMHARSALVTLMAVANSDMLTILPRQWLEIFEFAGHIAPLDITDPMPAGPMCMVRRNNMPLTPAAEYLHDMFRRSAHQYAARHKLR